MGKNADILGGVDRYGTLMHMLEQGSRNDPNSRVPHEYLPGALPIAVLYHEFLRKMSFASLDTLDFLGNLFSIINNTTNQTHTQPESFSAVAIFI